MKTRRLHAAAVLAVALGAATLAGAAPAVATTTAPQTGTASAAGAHFLAIPSMVTRGPYQTPGECEAARLAAIARGENVLPGCSYEDRWEDVPEWSQDGYYYYVLR
ncbi:hypothetical protein [Streptosporangium sp. NPDC002721]|uniref:hypothetical protein n=1 Tax=Streptosporangium sp. NPDC002721 TaxID=3366188 RepID=UPI0036892347